MRFLCQHNPLELTLQRYEITNIIHLKSVLGYHAGRIRNEVNPTTNGDKKAMDKYCGLS